MAFQVSPGFQWIVPNGCCCVFHRKVMLVIFNLQTFSFYTLGMQSSLATVLSMLESFTTLQLRFSALLPKVTKHTSPFSSCKTPGLTVFSHYDPLPKQPFGHWESKSQISYLSLLKPSGKDCSLSAANYI